MSQQYDNTDRGVLFKNDEKKSDRHPDYSGSLNVGGVEFFIDGWIKESQSGRKFMSLSVKLKQKAAEKPAQTKRGRVEDMDEPPFF